MLRNCIVCLMILLMPGAVAIAGDINAVQLAKTTQSWNGVSLPDYGVKETEVTVLKITVGPHTTLPMHVHPVINVAYMLSGELTVISAKGEKKIIKKGDTLVELVAQEHYGVNNSDEPVEILVVYVGDEGTPVTVKRQ